MHAGIQHCKHPAATPVQAVPDDSGPSSALTFPPKQMMLAMRSLEDEVLDLRVEAAIADNHMARLNNPAVARRIAALVQLSGAAVAAGEGEGGGAAQGGGTGAAGVGGGVGGAGVGVAEAMEVDGVGPEGGEGAS